MRLQSVCRDLGRDLRVGIHSDATAAIGIAKRRGLRKIRYLATAYLWVQDEIRDGHMEHLKIWGTENPGGISTKYVDKATMEAALKELNLVFKEGRSPIAQR